MNTLRRRRSIRQVALLSAAVIALSGLNSASAARATMPPFLRKCAPATTPAFLSQMAQALARVHGYQITLQTTSAGFGSLLAATRTAIVVRRGKARDTPGRDIHLATLGATDYFGEARLRETHSLLTSGH